MTNKAVVLAAGRGGRLERRTDGCAKCLVAVAGRPLIHYVLTSLAKAGLSEAVLVLGHHGEQAEANLGDGQRFGIKLHYVWNRDYTTGNASSLWRALPVVGGEPFLLAMADHLCSATLLRTFLASVDGRSAVAVDRSDLGAERTAEATKVALVDGVVADIGKELERWDGADTGFSHWAAGALAGRADKPPEAELAAMMARLARNEGGLAACDVSGHFWLDIDTEDDIRLAERLLRADEHRLA
jgi:MurNAc alpha-1-phosphate uridylyltransferase